MVVSKKSKSSYAKKIKSEARRPALKRSKTMAEAKRKEVFAIADETRLLQRELQLQDSFSLQAEASGAGLRPVAVVKQRYYENVNVGDNITAPYAYTFRTNSTWDPNETGTGHQPKGRDAYAANYNNYVVTGCRWKVFAKNIGEITACDVWAYVDTEATPTITTISHARETPSVDVISLRGQNENLAGEWGTLSGSVKMRDHMLPAGDFASQFVAAVGSNPTTPVRLHIMTSDITGGAIATNAIILGVYLEMDCVYKTPATAQFS